MIVSKLLSYRLQLNSNKRLLVTSNIKKEAIWAEVKKRYRLSNEIVQMAKKLGLNPKKLGSIANHHQQPWKQPLPEFIKSLYQQRFGEHAEIDQ
ncbi:TPA: hypothetical protein ACQDLI_002043 [Legionella pneumophila]